MLLMFCAIEDAKTARFIEDLFLLTKDGLFYYANSILHDEHLAENAVMSAFQIIINNPQYLKYKDPIENKAYMMVIVRNCARNYQRIYQREIFCLDETIPADEVSLEDMVINKLEFEHIKQLIAQLPQKYQDTLFLRYEVEYDFDEICDVTGITYDNAKQRVSRGVRNVKKLIQREVKSFERRSRKQRAAK